MQFTRTAAVPLRSPCIRNCQLDDDKICKGCKRSETEIMRWRYLTPEQQQKVLDNAAARKAQADA